MSTLEEIRDIRDRNEKEHERRRNEIIDEIKKLRLVLEERKRGQERQSELEHLTAELERLQRQVDLTGGILSGDGLTSSKLLSDELGSVPEEGNSSADAPRATSGETGGGEPENDNVLSDTGEDVIKPDPAEIEPEPLIPFDEILGLLELSSPAKKDWDLERSLLVEYPEQTHVINIIDKLMDMVGLESIKSGILAIRHKLDLTIRQAADVKFDRLGTVIVGNPGTGKTTVARHLASLLTVVSGLTGQHYFESSASHLMSKGVDYCQDELKNMMEEGGGVFFVDDAHQLVAGQTSAGRDIINFLLTETENRHGDVVFVLAGYAKGMEDVLACDPGLPARIPNKLELEDFTQQELAAILARNLRLRYKDSLRLEDGEAGLSTRVLARRISRGRGKAGFGNARAVENAVVQIANRQARRIHLAERNNQVVDFNLLTVVDMIGPEPGNALSESAAWTELQSMIGLQSVKDSVRVLATVAASNYQREILEQNLTNFSLNRVLLGNPGTGKTSVAKLYGRILADLGMLSDGGVVIKNPSDFIGCVLGESEAKTRAILAASLGKVLVIDEAYGLHTSMGSLAGNADPYRAAVIDTLVSEIQSVPGDDRCVLLLGYRAQMESMLQSTNPGLSRRFPIDSAFEFQDFSDEQLLEILNLELRRQYYHASDATKEVAIRCLARMRNRPNFGNAGAVHILLDNAKLRHQGRVSASGQSEDVPTLIEQDFDADFDRVERGDSEVASLFRDVVGFDALVERFSRYQTIARHHARLGLDVKKQIPYNFIFPGPPGTGKTTTARKIGKIFYNMGLLATEEVIECSVSDLVAPYTGQTGGKTTQLLRRALGKVLFIDEAYRLAEGTFAAEALNELVDSVTKPEFHQKLIIILAGYEKDMARLMSCNSGLASRFPESIVFPSLLPEQCYELLRNLLLSKLGSFSNLATRLDLQQLRIPSFALEVIERFDILTESPHWANGRDVELIASEVLTGVIVFVSEQDSGPINLRVLTLQELDRLLETRDALRSSASRAENHRSQDHVGIQEAQQTQPQTQAAIRVARATAAAMVSDDRDDDEHEDGLATSDAEEERTQQLLRERGLCPQGFAWLRQVGGYRCAGGSHWMSDVEIASLGR